MNGTLVLPMDAIAVVWAKLHVRSWQSTEAICCTAATLPWAYTSLATALAVFASNANGLMTTNPTPSQNAQRNKNIFFANSLLMLPNLANGCEINVRTFVKILSICGFFGDKGLFTKAGKTPPYKGAKIGSLILS